MSINEAPFFTMGDGDGIVVTNLGSGQYQSVTSILLPDGNILTGGQVASGFGLARYHPDGSLDLTFGNAGKLVASFSHQVASFTLQPDGKIVVVGTAFIESGRDFGVARYNSDGSLDASFDHDGKLSTHLMDDDYATSVAVQADGKILVGGYSYFGSAYFSLVRYNSDGSLDTTFDSDGKVTTSLTQGPNATSRSMLIQLDGKILIAGEADNNYAILRYNANGSLDSSFGTNGKVVTPVGSFYDGIYSIALQPDGKIIATGESSQDFSLVRYNADGSLDNSFGNTGKVITGIGNSGVPGAGYDRGYSVALQSDGKIIVGGFSGLDGSEDFSVVRYNADGSLDTTFGNSGKIFTDVGGSDIAYSVNVQADGKILLTGTHEVSGNTNFALVRYNPDGSLDSTFDSHLLHGSADYVEGASAVTLNPGVEIFDPELFAIDNYDGASLTLSRAEGANSQDSFTSKAGGTVDLLVEGDNLTVNGIAIGTIVTNSDGTLTIAFNSNSTQNLVNSALQQIAYSNTSDAPDSTIQLNWTFNDGNTGSQGVGGDLSVTDSTLVHITAVNDAPTFTIGDGKVSTDFFNYFDGAYSVVLQPDGKILASGYSTNLFGTGGDFAVVRYNPDGSLDQTFGEGGKVNTTFGSTTESAYSLALQPDGKIVLVGNSGSTNVGESSLAIARYNQDGSLDATFDNDGKAITDFGPLESSAYDVAIQSDGKIVAVGYADDAFNLSDFALVRYNTDGSLDTTFGPDGKVTTDFNASWDVANSVAIQSDGKILLAGKATNLNGDTDFALARYSSDGTLDLSFSADGKVTTDFGGSYDEGRGIVVQADGKILLVGHSNNNQLALARYNSDGTLDTSFDGDGLLKTSISGNNDSAVGVALQADGKILVVGWASSDAEGGQDLALVRYNTDGSLDTTFNTTGIVTTDLGTTYDSGYSVTVQADGKIVVAGSDGYDFSVIRYLPDGSLDSTFGIDDSLNGSVLYTENASPVLLDHDVQIYDAELAAKGNYAGATLTLNRDGGAANNQDVFSSQVAGTLSSLTQGSSLKIDVVTIGIVTTNSNGTLKLTFNTNATQTLIDSAMQQISYTNTSDAPPSSVHLNWLFNDGNQGAQGSGGSLDVRGDTIVYITATNDAPVVSHQIEDLLTQNGQVFSFQYSQNTFTDVDLTQLTYTATLDDGSALPEWIVFDAANRLFSGTVPMDIQSDLFIKVTATDPGNLSVTDTFRLDLDMATIINGGPGDNTLNGGIGDTTYNGNDGNDTIFAGSGNDTLNGGNDNDHLEGGAGNDSLDGGSGTDELFGDAGNDTLNGGTGADYLEGGTGNDTYLVDDIEDVLFEAANQGSDTIKVVTDIGLANFTLATAFKNFENFDISALAGVDFDIEGSASANVLTGNNAENLLSGLAGNDTLIGGDGDDTLDGGIGIDSLDGGNGNDIYVVDNAKDVIAFDTGGTDDQVNSTLSYSIASRDDIEHIRLIGTKAINATGNGGDNILVGNDANNVLDGGEGDDDLQGGAGNDTLIGGSGADAMMGGLGNDLYFIDDQGDQANEGANQGIDTLRLVGDLGLPGGFSISLTNSLENVENIDAIATGNVAVDLIGNASNNVLTGNDGINEIQGGAGADTLIGGKGDDTYIVNLVQVGTDPAKATIKIEDTITEKTNEGFDQVIVTGDFSNLEKYSSITLGANLEGLRLDSTSANTSKINVVGNTLNNIIIGNSIDNKIDGGAGNDSLSGNDGNDSLIGGAGNDTLDGGNGTDTLVGGAGNDVYIYDGTADIIVEAAGAAGGIDTVQTDVSFDLTSMLNVENLTLLGSADIEGIGNTLANYITGNSGENSLSGGAGNDTLDGGAGNDGLAGGLGNDTYIFDDLSDTINEGADEGTDTIRSSVTLSLALSYDNIENLTLTGDDDNDATGNDGANVLTGNDGNNQLSGGAGLDSLVGGKGDDTYIVNLLQVGTDPTKATVKLEDTITEKANEGQDEVVLVSNPDLVSLDKFSSITLGANIDNLSFQLDADTTKINIVGNALNNTISGNSVGNRIDGGAGNDSLTGNDGDDSLIGGAGNDTLDGGDGIDTLVGGAGNDVYLFDGTVDVIVEVAGAAGGIDTIQTNNSFGLTSVLNVENLTLLGSANIDGTGNSLANYITGNSGNNTLSGGVGNDTLEGGAGNDTLIGGIGNDTYIVDNLLDTVTEGVDEGNDTINAAFTYNLNLVANVENVLLLGTGNFNATGNALNNVLTGNAGNNLLIGNAGNDTLNGGDGNDTLNGGEGADLMTGGNGDDTYHFDNAKDIIRETSAAGGIDTINIALTGTSFTTYVVGKFFENAKLEDNTDIINLYGNSADNVLYGNNILNSKYIALGYSNYIDGAAGNDEIHTGNVANSTVNGGVGNDTIYGGTGANSYLYGGDGNDSIIGGTASVVIEGAGGNDTLDGGTGTDRMVSYSYSTSAVTIDLNVALQATSKGAGTDTLTHFNNITGSQYNDTLTGDGTANFIRGFLGNDTIAGGNGNDTLWGEAGNDSLSGGSGDDILLGGLGNDTLDGGVGGSDTVTYATTLGATAGVKVSLETETAQNTGGAGTDTLIGIENLFGSSFADTLTGNTNANTLNGGDGNDTINGGNGADTLIGGAGNDSLIGGDGNDSITGGTGKDFLTGGLGDDIFVFNSSAESGIGSVADTITDFGIGLDKIDLSAIDANTSSSGTNEAFSFIGEKADFDGTNDTRVPGQLRFEINDNDPNSISVFGDTNGDGAADFQIILTGITSVSAGDFIL